MKVIVTLLIIISFFFYSCKSSRNWKYNYAARHTAKNDYRVIELDSTSNYYIIKTSDSLNHNITVVVEKLSKQIRGKKIKVNQTYTLSTRSIYDDFSGANLGMQVEGKMVWLSKDSYDYRYTENLGNENDTIINGREIINGKKDKVIFGHD
jgi:hypothetical protein